MTDNFEDLFAAEDAALRKDADYQLEAFFLDITENIHLAMKHAGIKTKTELAGMLGVTPARVSQFLGGYKKNPELRTIVQYAIALGVEPSELCAPRKTRELYERPPFLVGSGFETAKIEKAGSDEGDSKQVA